MSTPARNAQTAALEALIEAHAIELKLPTVRRRFKALAAEALREQQTPVAYLGALLEAEMSERAERREKRRLNDARFPQIKRLEDFRFADNPNVPQATIAALAEGSWIDDRESVILVGDSGTGKTMLATALGGLRVPSGTPCPVHHARRLRERTPRSPRQPRARARRRALRPDRASRLRRTGISGAARRRRRARLPGPLRTTRTRQPDHHHQPAVQRMDQGVPRPAARESRRRPAHAPSAHHRHRQRELAVPPRPRTPNTQPRMTPRPGNRYTAAIATAPRATRSGLRDDSRGLAFRRAIRQHQHQQQPTPGGATSSHRAGASASHRSQRAVRQRFRGVEPLTNEWDDLLTSIGNPTDIYPGFHTQESTVELGSEKPGFPPRNVSASETRSPLVTSYIGRIGLGKVSRPPLNPAG